MSEPSFYSDAFDKTQQPDVEPVVELEEEEEEEDITLEEETLLTRGYFSDTVTLGTHKIVLRTLKVGEELEIALIAQKYLNTIEASRAVITATVAAAIQSVDGRPLIPFPLGQAESGLQAKFDYITEN